ncbi:MULTISPECIES: hypothetical protein [Candidatus Ichthyocystis]|uniref:hypothetical protein n=1 Tax=Candidatus Ichthyocystis TaxID=2929841 RepID=UPI001584EE5A|nr:MULTISPECIES: hypothetical protein [Ichthyocystis]
MRGDFVNIYAEDGVPSLVVLSSGSIMRERRAWAVSHVDEEISVIYVSMLALILLP